LQFSFFCLLVIMLTVNSIQSNLTVIVGRFLTAGFMSAIAILGGFVPEVSRQVPKLVFNFSAYAQDISQQEVVNYTNAVYNVEMLRQQVYKQMQESTSEPPAGIICDRPETYQNLADDVKAIAVNYCNESKEIVEKNHLSVSRFNQLKGFYDRQEGFYQQVQNILLERQK
jgi:hypothetical protein